MHIKAWHIDGFGVLHDRRVDGLARGLTVFVGPNEAGKSTLLGFLRAMLFGFPSKRSGDLQYPPLAGGRAGGTLVLEVPPHNGSPGGELTITRYDEKRNGLSVILPGGVAGTEQDLQSLLGQADRGLFQSIFAFSLTELQSLASLKEQGVRDRIFSAGIAGAGRSACGVIKRLGEDLESLYLPGGRKNRIRILVNELESLSQEIDEARRQVHRYGELCAQESQCQQEMELAAKREDELRSEAARWGLLEELWPVHLRAKQLQAQLDELPAVDEFVPQGLTRLTERLARVESAGGKAAELAAALATVRQEQAKLASGLDETLAAVAAAVEAHAADLNLHRDRLQHRSAADLAVTQAQENLALTLRDLGPGWDEDHVAACDTSLARQEEVGAWREQLARAATDQADAQRRQVQAQRQQQEAAQDAAALAERLGNAPRADVGQIDQAEAAIRELWKDLPMLDELRRQQAAAAAAPAAGDGSKDRRMPMAVGALATVLLAVAVWRLVAGDVATFAVMAVMAAGMAAWAILARTRRTKQDTHNVPGLPARTAQVQGRVLTRAKELGLSGACEVVSDAAKIASLVGEIARELPALEQRWRAVRRQADQQDMLASQVAQAREKVSRREAELAHAAADLEKANLATAELGQQWRQYKQGLRLGDSLSPEAVMVFLSKVESARKEVLGVSHARQRAADLRGQIAAWQDRAGDLLRQAGRAVPASEGAVIDALVGLKQDVADDRRRRGEHAEASRRVTQLEAQAQQANVQAQQAQEQLAQLLTEAGADGEAAFRQKHEWYTQRQELRRQLVEAQQQLAARVGQGPQAAALSEELAGGQTALWQQRRSAAAGELPQVQAARESAVRRHQDAATARTAMEESADVPALEVRIESLRCELAAAVDQWRVKALAKSLVETTLGEFVRASQPAVLAQASGDFARVTESAYTRIEQDVEAASLAVVDRNHARKGPEQLSRGTADQLYLCLRLGLAREFASQRVALPVVMDDVLVNFDPHRAELMAAVLADFARDHQVLLLTCHPSTVELLRSVCPGLRVEQM